MNLLRRARLLKRDVYVLYLACRDPRTPWYAKVVAAAVVAYALSPIDLIPDFIPVLGQLDDLILVPVGVGLALRLIPPGIIAEHRAAAGARLSRTVGRAGLIVVVLIWVLIAYAAYRILA